MKNFGIFTSTIFANFADFLRNNNTFTQENCAVKKIKAVKANILTVTREFFTHLPKILAFLRLKKNRAFKNICRGENSSFDC